MVHNLRSRNICQTSPKTAGNAVTVTFAEEGTTTPLVQPDFFQSTNYPLSSTRHDNRVSFSSFRFSVENEEHLVGDNTLSDISNSFQQNKDISIDGSTSERESSEIDDTSGDISSYRQNLYAAINDVIFSKTFNVSGGVSLVRIKKSLHDEYGYDPSKFKKVVSQYVKQSLSEGKLKQISGRGANGSFRINKILHNRLIRAHKLQSVTKLRNVSAKVNLKRFQKNDSTIMAQILNQTKEAQRTKRLGTK